MTGPEAVETLALKWSSLPQGARAALRHKLEGMYGGAGDESVFDSLAIDKQQALLILARRFRALDLWEAVRAIENLYGVGGTGMHFRAWPFLRSTLLRRRDFTTWFARHRHTGGGFLERGTGSRNASLHLLYTKGEAGHWEAHFDLYNPWASPFNAWRHLLHEKIRGETPGWRAVGLGLGYVGEGRPYQSGDDILRSF